MRLASEIRSDLKAAKKMRLPRWAILPLIVVSFLSSWILDHFGLFNLMLPIWNMVGVLGFMIALKRKLWPHGWFWITMTVIAALHVALIPFVPWGTKWVPALVIAGIDSVDFCLILWVFDAVGRLVEGPKAAQK